MVLDKKYCLRHLNMLPACRCQEADYSTTYRPFRSVRQRVCRNLCTIIGVVAWPEECCRPAAISAVRICVLNCSEEFIGEYMIAWWEDMPILTI